MALLRRIDRVVTTSPPTPGFAGAGHLATRVLSPEEFALNDPFIALMDDHLDMGDRRVGGAHPHAGFETVTLVLDGTIHDPDEGGVIGAGEVQWMTAGRGIIHGENTHAAGRSRLLQLWLTLPQSQRWVEPGFQDLHADRVPIRREPGAVVRVYSGASAGVSAPTRNHVPVTMVEITMEAQALVDQDLPASYNGFLYVLDGSVTVGEANSPLEKGQVGWLQRSHGEETSLVRIGSGASGARLVLYAGEPQGGAIVSYGPFIGDSNGDISRLFAEYRAGRFSRMSEVAAPVRRTAAGALRV